LLTASVWRGKNALRYFGIGLWVGATTVAAVAAILGGIVQSILPPIFRWVPFFIVVLAVFARELGVASFPIPENKRLVPESVTYRGAEAGGFQFGFEMGTGMRTYSPSALPHLVLAGIFLVVPFGGALLAAAGFALGRWAMAAASVGYDEDGSWSDVWAAHRRLLAMAMAMSMLLAGLAGLR
jgi:hypothetical protein